MDKILSADEWIKKNNSKGINLSFYKLINGYSTYLLEAFAEDVKREGKVDLNTAFAKINPHSIDQLLTKFKEKL